MPRFQPGEPDLGLIVGHCVIGRGSRDFALGGRKETNGCSVTRVDNEVVFSSPLGSDGRSPLPRGRTGTKTCWHPVPQASGGFHNQRAGDGLMCRTVRSSLLTYSAYRSCNLLPISQPSIVRISTSHPCMAYVVAIIRCVSAFFLFTVLLLCIRTYSHLLSASSDHSDATVPQPSQSLPPYLTRTYHVPCPSMHFIYPHIPILFIALIVSVARDPGPVRINEPTTVERSFDGAARRGRR